VRPDSEKKGYLIDLISQDQLPAGTVEVRGTVIRVKERGLMIKTAPKTRAGFRTLVLPSWAVEMLGLRPQNTPDQTVFCSALGGLRDRDNVIGDLRNALNAARLRVGDESHIPAYGRHADGSERIDCEGSG
jgi:hypothetical protein